MENHERNNAKKKKKKKHALVLRRRQCESVGPMNRASQKSCFATLTPLLPMSTVAQALLETEKSNSFLQSATVQKEKSNQASVF
jgi:hypothetical protein